MTGQRVGYIRVSSLDQNESRQLEGEALDRIFTDKASGKNTHRPQLQELLRFVRQDDTVIVHSMDRLARNLDDLRNIVQTLTGQGSSIFFVKEGLTFNGEDSPMSNLLLSVMGAFAEFERSIIKERQREGIELAKRKGVYKGRARSITDEKVKELKERVTIGENKTALAKEYGISRQTLYSYLTKSDIKAG